MFDRTLRAAEARFVLALSLLFLLAVLAVSVGVAAIVGAFLAGLALAESTEARERDLAQGVSEFLVPFFLAGIGLHVDLSVFATPATAILARGAAGGRHRFEIRRAADLGLLDWARSNALRVGVGMIPRGEVGMIVAQIGLGFGILSRSSYSVVVFMSVATTIVAPPLHQDRLPEPLESRGRATGRRSSPHGVMLYERN